MPESGPGAEGSVPAAVVVNRRLMVIRCVGWSIVAPLAALGVTAVVPSDRWVWLIAAVTWAALCVNELRVRFEVRGDTFIIRNPFTGRTVHAHEIAAFDERTPPLHYLDFSQECGCLGLVLLDGRSISVVACAGSRVEQRLARTLYLFRQLHPIEARGVYTRWEEERLTDSERQAVHEIVLATTGRTVTYTPPGPATFPAGLFGWGPAVPMVAVLVGLFLVSVAIDRAAELFERESHAYCEALFVEIDKLGAPLRATLVSESDRGGPCESDSAAGAYSIDPSYSSVGATYRIEGVAKVAPAVLRHYHAAFRSNGWVIVSEQHAQGSPYSPYSSLEARAARPGGSFAAFVQADEVDSRGEFVIWLAMEPS